MRFKRYLIEVLNESMSISNLQYLSKESKLVNRLVKFIDEINIYISADEIPNTKFLELKRIFGFFIDTAIFRSSDPNIFNWAYKEDLIYHSGNQIKGKLKKAESIKSDDSSLELYLGLTRELLSIQNVLDYLKGKIVKRERGDKKKETEFHKKMASSEAIKIVHKILTELTNNLKKGYSDYLYSFFLEIINRYKESDEKIKRNLLKEWGIILYHVFEIKHNIMEIHEKPNWEQKIKSEADKQTDAMQQSFLYKNVNKLAEILELKGNLKGEPRILNLKADRGVFEGDIKMEFDDGSSFEVRNKVIVKSSIHGKFFNQFPTTFHNAILPDGKRMIGQPSEKDMIQIFAGEKS